MTCTARIGIFCLLLLAAQTVAAYDPVPDPRMSKPPYATTGPATGADRDNTLKPLPRRGEPNFGANRRLPGSGGYGYSVRSQERRNND